MSLVALATAGIGEEIVFRGFMMGLWAFLLNLILRRSGDTTAALAFVAGHAPMSLRLFNVGSSLRRRSACWPT